MSKDDVADMSPKRLAKARTIPGLLQQAAANDPQAIALISSETGEEISHAALAETVSDLASALLAEASVGRSRPRIGLVLPNGLTLTVALLAASVAGEATPFNPALTMAEYERYFTTTRIDVLVMSDTENGPVVRAAEALQLPILRMASDLTLQAGSDRVPLMTPSPDDIAMVLMTSGSTGTPKIVPLRHRNVCRSAQDVAASLALGPQDRCLVMWQQFHIGGLVDLLLAPLCSGGTIILTSGFDAGEFFELRARFAPTWFQGVPTTLGELIRHADREHFEPGAGSLRLIRSVAAALSPKLQARLQDFFGVPVVRTFGMTEAAPLITSTQLPPARDKPGSVGRACGPEVRILDAGGEPAGTGETGDVAIRGENVFSGYEGNPDANAAAFRDGWFLTGDRGWIDEDGDLFLAGRASEQINRGGYKIMPSEVEEALLLHHAVREAAVFGMTHATLGEDVAAAVALAPGNDVDVADLRAHLSQFLSANKIPGQILIREDLPRNPVGKVDRMALALLAGTLASSSSVLVPPRTPTERALAEIWMRELELPEIGTRQDFMMVGGDSLSALRVIVAMEEAFAAAMPDAIVENLTTIENVAARLDEAGLVPSLVPDPVPPNNPKAREPDAFRPSEIGETEIATALENTADGADLFLLMGKMVAYRTPAQIEAMFQQAPARNIGTRRASFLKRLRLRRAFRIKRNEFLSEIETRAGPARLWAREEVTPAATLYSFGDVPAWQKTLIVGFSGNKQRMNMETFRFLLPLDPMQFDFLLLRDTAKTNLYISGLPEMGEGIDSLGAWLTDHADAAGYRFRIALGCSGGGLGAIFTGLAYDWDRTVAMSPPRLSKHSGYEPLIRGLGAEKETGQANVWIANGQNLNDIDASRQLLARLPGARHDFHADCPGHNVLNYARQNGGLDGHYARWFDLDDINDQRA